MRPGTAIVLSVGLSIFAGPAAGQKYPTIPYKEAADHVDEIVWVRGTVLRVQSASEGTYLYFHNDRKYIFVLIPTEYLANFKGGPSHLYTNKRIEAFGKVQKDGAKLLLAVDQPKKIKIVPAEKPT
jgi:hypothetical protein